MGSERPEAAEACSIAGESYRASLSAATAVAAR